MKIEGGQSGRGRQKFLIADDDPRMRRMIRELVAALASEIFEARSGSEAVALYMIERPDWVLMDLQMKPMDGLRATAEIMTKFPQARVIIVSQHDEAELRAEAARVGARAYVLKDNLHELPEVLIQVQQQRT